ncbi:hypothetical protein Ciccas_011507 [Cichlidogyrus casuarinus]|uniref:Uncharacterized protein n=1 Tax=Cichlidogyrus casuarinus TaxID=1844966 RepID=A0ABD2PR11_9PLAT
MAAENIAKNGLTPNSAIQSYLGDPGKGVFLSLCFDVAALERVLNNEFSLNIVVFKWISCRNYFLPLPDPYKYMQRPFEPQPGYTAHVTEWNSLLGINVLEKHFQQQFTFEALHQANMVYLFSYNEDLELLPSPDHVLPYAVLQIRTKPTICRITSQFKYRIKSQPMVSHSFNEAPRNNTVSNFYSLVAKFNTREQALGEGRKLQNDQTTISESGKPNPSLQGSPKLISSTILVDENNWQAPMRIYSHKLGRLSILPRM